VDVAGLEPAAPCLSGRGYARDTPTILRRYFVDTNMLVDVTGIEPATPCLQSRCKFNLSRALIALITFKPI